MSILALSDYVIKGATIVASTIGNTVIVPAVQGKMIALIQCILSSEGTVSVKFQSGTSHDLTGLFYLIAGSDFELPGSNVAWCLTTRGESLTIDLSGNVAVGGVVNYIEVD